VLVSFIGMPDLAPVAREVEETLMKIMKEASV
jgi:hypothetical protein